MAQINFPVATAAGQIFEADTGVLYTYVGTPPNGYWSGTFGSEGTDTLDSRYVKKEDGGVPQTIKSAGLKINNNNSNTIVLEGSGSITAAGNVASDTGGFYRTGQSGIVFSGSSIIPADGNGAPNNTLNDLGATLYQFKDGYFYGEVTTGSITASAREASTFADGDIRLNSDGSGSFGDAKIVLRADGSITAAGQLDVGSILSASGGFRSNPEGTVFINPASTAPDTATVFLTYKDRSVDSSTGVSFTKAGSATFAGSITAAGPATVGSGTVYTRIYNGNMLVSNVGTAGQAFGVYNTTAGAYTVQLDFDGSITAAGDITAGSDIVLDADAGVYLNGGGSSSNVGVTLNNDGFAYFARSNAATPFIRGYRTDTGDNTFSVLADGSITAAGNIQSGGNAIASSPEAGVVVRSTGLVSAARGSGQNIFTGFTTGNADSTIQITADGSITAAGMVAANAGLEAYIPTNNILSNSQRWFDNKYSTRGVVATMGMGGSFWTKQSVTVGTDINDAQVTISSNGSITAAGAIQSGGLAYNGDRGFVTSANGTVYVSSVANGQIWQGYTEGSTTPTSSIFADGSITAKGRLSVTTLSTGGDYTIYFKNEDAAAARQNAFAFTNDGKLQFFAGSASTSSTVEIDSVSGDATFNGTVTATVVPPSDARFKENIEPAKPQLADVVALGGILKNYDWNDQAPLNEELRSQRQLGLIAQEAAEVCPAIVKDIHRTKTVEVTPAVKGPKGKVIKEAVTEEADDSYKGISQDALIMKLIGAVAELSAEVEALKAAK